MNNKLRDFLVGLGIREFNKSNFDEWKEADSEFTNSKLKVIFSSVGVLHSPNLFHKIVSKIHLFYWPEVELCEIENDLKFIQAAAKDFRFDGKLSHSLVSSIQA